MDTPAFSKYRASLGPRYDNEAIAVRCPILRHFFPGYQRSFNDFNELGSSGSQVHNVAQRTVVAVPEGATRQCAMRRPAGGGA